MSVFTKQFASIDEYEDWLLGVGERINVLSITNPTGKGIYKPRKPRQLWIRNSPMPAEVPLTSSGKQADCAITVKYHTSDQTLLPPKNKYANMAQVALIAAASFALFGFAISKL